jgi:outer membrane protein OmpA-like peptidoglycan-associated protein
MDARQLSLLLIGIVTAQLVPALPAASKPTTAQLCTDYSNPSARRTAITPARVVRAKVKPAQVVPAKVVPARIVRRNNGQPPQIIPAQITPAQIIPAQITPAQIEPAVIKTATETRITLSTDLLFDFDKANIRPDAGATLKKMLPTIQATGNAPIRIEGHTDAKGSKTYNQDLSQQRAVAVQQWLAQQSKIGSRRMTTCGFGELRPVAPNTNPNGSDNPSGRQKNRRVEIVIQQRAEKLEQ